MTEQTALTDTILDCSHFTTREINQRLREFAAAGLEQVTILNPAGRHNLAVGLDTAMQITIQGSVGYFCGGLGDRVQIEINGSCGWSVGENLMAGQILVRGNASANAAASARGGNICIFGDAGARAGISLKGATLLVTGNVGPSSAFMMQHGRVIICGNAGPNLGDSLYEGKIFVGGAVHSLGADARFEPMTEEDWHQLDQELAPWGMAAHQYDFKKIVCAKQLYTFKAKDFAQWKDLY
jgi:glutamate synthase domain-containing protein 3